jgi:hypothetical protein
MGDQYTAIHEYERVCVTPLRLDHAVVAKAADSHNVHKQEN